MHVSTFTFKLPSLSLNQHEFIQCYISNEQHLKMITKSKTDILGIYYCNEFLSG